MGLEFFQANKNSVFFLVTWMQSPLHHCHSLLGNCFADVQEDHFFRAKKVACMQSGRQSPDSVAKTGEN
jgi:hypothetical protein